MKYYNNTSGWRQDRVAVNDCSRADLPTATVTSNDDGEDMYILGLSLLYCSRLRLVYEHKLFKQLDGMRPYRTCRIFARL